MRYFISSEKIGVCDFSLPTITRACCTTSPSSDQTQAIFRHVDHDVPRAEIGRQPAPALHVGDQVAFQHRARLAGQGRDGAGVENAVGRQPLGLLEFRDRRRDALVVEGLILAVLVEFEMGADQRHARDPACRPAGSGPWARARSAARACARAISPVPCAARCRSDAAGCRPRAPRRHPARRRAVAAPRPACGRSSLAVMSGEIRDSSMRPPRASRA